MVNGIVFREIANRPDCTHVGAWRDDDGVITVAYLGIFSKQSVQLAVHVGGAQQHPETLANTLLEELVRQAQARQAGDVLVRGSA